MVTPHMLMLRACSIRLAKFFRRSRYSLLTVAYMPNSATASSMRAILHIPILTVHLPPCLFLFHSVGRLKRQMAEMCVKAVLAVADLERKDVNLDLIKVRWLGRRLV